MSKFLFFTDAHAKGVNSANRKGNYFEDWLIKFEEMLQIAKENKVEAIFDGGDLIDVAEPSYRVLDSIIDLIEKYKIHMYSLYGNHALRFRSKENSRYTGIAHMIKRCAYVHELNEYNENGILCKGYEYTHTIEEDINESGIILEKSDDWKIAIIHAMIMEKPFFKDTPHCVCKNIKTNADLVLLGHYHHPFIVKTKTTTFLNVGSFGRNSINEMNIVPSVVLLDTETKDYEIIKLKSAKNADDLFDRELFDKSKEKKKTIEEFLEAMKDTNIQGMDFTQQIKEIGKTHESSKQVIEYLLQKTEEIQNEE